MGAEYRKEAKPSLRLVSKYAGQGEPKARRYSVLWICLLMTLTIMLTLRRKECATVDEKFIL